MRHAWLVPVLLACATGCRSTDPATLTRDGREVRALDPLPCRIALASWQDWRRAEPGEDDRGYGFTLEPDQAQDLMVAVLDPGPAAKEQYRLDSQRAANEVFRLDARTLPEILEQAQRAQADLVIRPRLIEPPHLTFEGYTRTLPSVAWWLFTWVGGLFVQDKSYTARMTVDFDLINPYDGTTIDTFTATSETMDLTLIERDGRRFSGRSALSLLLPPQLTGDTRSRTNATLSQFLCARFGARIAGYLKDDFTARERELLGALRAVEPRNGARVGDELPFRAEILGERPLTGVALYLNGARTPVWSLSESSDGDGLLEPARQAAGTWYRILVAGPDGSPLRIPGLVPGRNRLRVEYAVQGRYASRTLEYERPTEGGPE